MFHGDNPPARIVLVSLLSPSSEGSWCYQEDFVEVSHGEQQHGVPNSQASLFLFVCLSVHVQYFGKLDC